jgi:hypothetical protein
MRSAATPEAIRCSAQTTPPLPPSRRKAPIAAVARHSTRVGRGAPVARAQA